MVTTLIYPAESDPAGAVLILGHGAGAGQHSPWMVDFARDLSGRGLDIVTFNFPYIEQGRKVPDRRPLLDACYRAVIAAVQERAARANPPSSSAANPWAAGSRRTWRPQNRRCR